jgi:diguanylate cyclase (GGDEF)-like protein/PAS domain S-box-containing protein
MSIDTLRMILYAASAAMGILVIYSIIRQKSHLAHYFFFVALCAFLYIFGYASELGARSLADIRFWLTFEYFGLAFITSFWFLLSWKLWYNHNPRFRMNLLVFLTPVITLFLVTTQEYQGLFYKSLAVAEIEGHHLVIIEKGPWYWVQNGYQFLMILMSFFLQWRAWRRKGGSYATDNFWILLGTLNLVPWMAVYQLGLSPHNIDLGPFGIAVATFFIAVAVFHFGALSSEEVLLYSIFASIDDGVVVLDQGGKISEFNTAAQKIFPWLDAGCIGKPVINPHDASLFAVAQNQKIEKMIELSGSRRYYQGKFTQIYEGHSKLGRIYMFRDVTESRLLMKRLRKFANFDVLTGLYNRRRFVEQAEKALLRAQENESYISILMIDVDHFKNVNDRFGHAVGDRVLSAVGHIIRRRSRGIGFAGRYGGEEFVVLLQKMTKQEAMETAEGIRKGIEGIAIEKRMIPVKVTVSIGVSCCGAGECIYNVDTLLTSADHALYQAKNRGRNRVED